jgi:hypothetical protein
VRGLGEDIAVRKSLQPFVAQVPGVMPGVSQPIAHSTRNPHIG